MAKLHGKQILGLFWVSVDLMVVMNLMEEMQVFIVLRLHYQYVLQVTGV